MSRSSAVGGAPGGLADLLKRGVKLRQRPADSFAIRNLQCEPATGAPYKTQEECQAELAKLKSHDALMAVLNTIDPQYRDALVKYEAKASEISSTQAQLKKAAGNPNKEKKLRGQLETLNEQYKKLGEAVAEMEREFQSALPDSPSKRVELVQKIKDSGGVDSFKEFAELYEGVVGKKLSLPSRLAASVTKGAPKSRALPKGSPSPAAARVASVVVPQQQTAGSNKPVIVNIYNNIAYGQQPNTEPAPLGDPARRPGKTQKVCVNCPPLPGRGEKRKMDTYMLDKYGTYKRLYVGSRGAVYTYDKRTKKYKSLKVKSKKLV